MALFTRHSPRVLDLEQGGRQTMFSVPRAAKDRARTAHTACCMIERTPYRRGRCMLPGDQVFDIQEHAK